uniref:Uncharacterized protein n=1 Tax=Oryza nivara TaxID=4536 RepID=A0A0E0GNQ5_ORYNI
MNERRRLRWRTAHGDGERRLRARSTGSGGERRRRGNVQAEVTTAAATGAAHGGLVVLPELRRDLPHSGEEAVGDGEEGVGAEVEGAEAAERLRQHGEVIAEGIEAEVEFGEGREHAEVGADEVAGETAAAGVDGSDAPLAVAGHADPGAAAWVRRACTFARPSLRRRRPPPAPVHRAPVHACRERERD